MPTIKRCITLSIALLAAVACAPASTRNDGDTLYRQMGGEPVLRGAVSEFSDLVLDDSRINFTFANADMDAFRRQIFDQLCNLSGGPCEYTGRDMKTSHSELAITDTQFNAIAEDLYLALDRAGVAYRLQNRLMALLAPMRNDIVTR